MQPFANSSNAAAQASNTDANAKPAGAPPKPAHTADVKPRLTKEQHDILESHFQIHHKPSTSTKKGFADNLGVPLDKINNWFQNRRAKVKQDLKKQMNQYNMTMGTYPPAPVMMTTPQQFPQHREQAQPQLSMSQGFFPVNADISPASVPVQSVEGPSALDLGPQMTLQQPYDMHHSLRSIPEADRATSYHPDAVMHSIMAATAGASYMQNQAVSMHPQGSGFSYEGSMPNGLPAEVDFSMSTAISNAPEPSHDLYGGLGDYLAYAPLLANGPNDLQNSTGSMSAEASPFSGAQSNGTTQSSTDPNHASVASIASMYSGWTDENVGADVKQAEDTEDMFDTPYNMPQGSVSEAALPPFWTPNTLGQTFSHGDVYQHSNASAHAVLSSPGQGERKLSNGLSDIEIPNFGGDDIFARRNSSTSNLATNIEAIHIQNSTPEGLKSPTQSSSIAARRQKRPTALNSNTLRSASYSGGMPSPGSSNDHTLRRIRSSGIPNAAGRVQKPNPGSAQRSPMSLTFTDAASSPKFARAFSSSNVTTVGQGGSRAPPTPQTPNETRNYPSWQSNTVFRNNQQMPDHSSPESQGTSWSIEPTVGVYSNGESPPTLDNQTPLATDGLYRDTPPQSAPATQQGFPRPTLMQPPRLRAGFHSSTDLTLAQPKPVNHFRRPSLPTESAQGDEANVQYAGSFSNFNYEDFKDFPLSGIQHNVPFAPPVSAMPDFLVHQYAPPQDPHGHMRRTTEPATRHYIFANQGPRDFHS